MTIQEANISLLSHLYNVYDKGEAESIADLIMENLTGWKRVDRIMNNGVQLSQSGEDVLGKYISQLLNDTPVQYILHEAWFSGMKFYVDENVLIPRPETEELVEWIVSENSGKALKILDIGTGSGCIAVALKRRLPLCQIMACDVSDPALEIARRNAETNFADVIFLKVDILNKKERDHLPDVDIIVSNPPYIPASEKKLMGRNVIAYEPHLALFVDDRDPLLFYKAIADMRAKSIYVEVHEDLAKETAELFTSPKVRDDMQGKPRMIRSSRLSITGF